MCSRPYSRSFIIFTWEKALEVFPQSLDSLRIMMSEVSDACNAYHHMTSVVMLLSPHDLLISHVGNTLSSYAHVFLIELQPIAKRLAQLLLWGKR